MQLRFALVVVIALGGADRASAEKAKQGHVVVTDTTVEILDHVTFEKDTASLTQKSHPILDAVAATLKGNPGILLVEVQSHTSDQGDQKHNQALSQQRADAVVNYLVAAQVERARLTAQGYGGTQPIDRSHTAAAWAKNERVAFLVLQRAK
jgi:outer membrane protein OmpA-like peptidoglycan-associated protein